MASYFIRLRVLPRKLVPTNLWALMNSVHMKRVLFDTARGAIGQANINSKELKAFPTMLPPLERQIAFKRYVEAAESIIGQQRDAGEMASATLAALLHQSFRMSVTHPGAPAHAPAALP